MNGSSSNRATFAPKDSSAALKIIADGKEHLRREQKWRERFEAYSFPDAGELKRRIREEGLMLRAEDCACLRYAVGCLEHREKAAEWFRGLAEVLQGMADTHGAEAKAVALRFRRILDDSDPVARLEEALVKCADFAERCFIGGARTETPPRDTATQPGKPRRRGPKPVIPPGCYQTQSLLAAALETSSKNVSLWVRGEGRPPRDFCWPFPIGDKKRLDKCKEEIRRRRESREATAGATKILKKGTRRPKPQAYNEEWGKHNGDPQ